MIGHRLAALAAAALTLAACSQQKPATPPAETQTRAPAAPAPAPGPGPAGQATLAEGETIGGDGSQIDLSGLTLADRKANPLDGELGCGFSVDGADPLLTVMGYSGTKDPAHGLVKVAGYVERVASPAGLNGIAKGATFTGAGKTVTVAATGPSFGGGESPPIPATLTYDRADGAKRVYAGTWTCGP